LVGSPVLNGNDDRFAALLKVKKKERKRKKQKEIKREMNK